jgi:hypothetical protein
MLRITRIDTPTGQKLILEGRLTEPWIADLSSHWEETRRAHPERKFVIDLRGSDTNRSPWGECPRADESRRGGVPGQWHSDEALG